MLKGLASATFSEPDAEAQLWALLGGYGKVEELRLIPEHGAAKVVFSNNLGAENAGYELNYSEFLGQTMFATSFSTMDKLAVPDLEKQWLISPPPSPPIGWEPKLEDPPVVSQDLIDALQGMDPTVPRDIYTGSGNLPTISVALVVTEAEEAAPKPAPKKKMMSFMSMPPPWAKGSAVHGGPWQMPKGLGGDKGNLAAHARTMMPPSNTVASMANGMGLPPKLRMPPRGAKAKAAAAVPMTGGLSSSDSLPAPVAMPSRRALPEESSSGTGATTKTASGGAGRRSPSPAGKRRPPPVALNISDISSLQPN